MAINKKLIHFKTKQNFNNEVAKGNILDTSIVFIKDCQEVHTHGETYKAVNWSVLEDNRDESVTPSLISFTIDGNNYEAENGMTWKQFIESEYNDGSFVIYNGSPCFNGCVVLLTSSGHIAAKSEDKIINNYEYYYDSRSPELPG